MQCGSLIAQLFSYLCVPRLLHLHSSPWKPLTSLPLKASRPHLEADSFANNGEYARRLSCRSLRVPLALMPKAEVPSSFWGLTKGCATYAQLR
ncbi:MAG: hypothetical protein ACKERG_00690 [Candidatus Hodgkinia cicadicola]